MPIFIPNLRPYMTFTDGKGSLTKEAYDFLYLLFRRVGDVQGMIDAATLEGFTWEEPGKIGSTTPNTGAFTFFETTRDTNLAPQAAAAIPATPTSPAVPASIGTIVINPQAQGSLNNVNVGVVTPRYGGFSSLQSVGAFGCNGASPQPSYSVGGGVATTAATNTTPYGFTTAAQANAIVTKLNAVIAALTNNGITI